MLKLSSNYGKSKIHSHRSTKSFTCSKARAVKYNGSDCSLKRNNLINNENITYFINNSFGNVHSTTNLITNKRNKTKNGNINLRKKKSTNSFEPEITNKSSTMSTIINSIGQKYQETIEDQPFFSQTGDMIMYQCTVQLDDSTITYQRAIEHNDKCNKSERNEKKCDCRRLIKQMHSTNLRPIPVYVITSCTINTSSHNVPTSSKDDNTPGPTSPTEISSAPLKFVYNSQSCPFPTPNEQWNEPLIEKLFINVNANNSETNIYEEEHDEYFPPIQEEKSQLETSISLSNSCDEKTNNSSETVKKSLTPVQSKETKATVEVSKNISPTKMQSSTAKIPGTFPSRSELYEKMIKDKSNIETEFKVENKKDANDFRILKIDIGTQWEDQNEDVSEDSNAMHQVDTKLPESDIENLDNCEPAVGSFQTKPSTISQNQSQEVQATTIPLSLRKEPPIHSKSTQITSIDPLNCNTKAEKKSSKTKLNQSIIKVKSTTNSLKLNVETDDKKENPEVKFDSSMADTSDSNDLKQILPIELDQESASIRFSTHGKRWDSEPTSTLSAVEKSDFLEELFSHIKSMSNNKLNQICCVELKEANSKKIELSCVCNKEVEVKSNSTGKELKIIQEPEVIPPSDSSPIDIFQNASTKLFNCFTSLYKTSKQDACIQTDSLKSKDMLQLKLVEITEMAKEFPMTTQDKEILLDIVALLQLHINKDQERSRPSCLKHPNDIQINDVVSVATIEQREIPMARSHMMSPKEISRIEEQKTSKVSFCAENTKNISSPIRREPPQSVSQSTDTSYVSSSDQINYKPFLVTSKEILQKGDKPNVDQTSEEEHVINYTDSFDNLLKVPKASSNIKQKSTNSNQVPKIMKKISKTSTLISSSSSTSTQSVSGDLLPKLDLKKLSTKETQTSQNHPIRKDNLSEPDKKFLPRRRCLCVQENKETQSRASYMKKITEKSSNKYDKENRLKISHSNSKTGCWKSFFSCCKHT